MKKLLYIDCCIRGEQSRTKIISEAFVNVFRRDRNFSVETLELDKFPASPLGHYEYQHREALLAQGRTDDSVFDFARQFAAADLIVVAAPFWDMGIPAKLKIYFENVSVCGFTFGFDGERFSGLCNASQMVYITTRGMDIADGSVMEQASPYLYALTKFFGIDNFDMVSAYGLDVRPSEAEQLVESAVSQATALANTTVCGADVPI